MYRVDLTNKKNVILYIIYKLKIYCFDIPQIPKKPVSKPYNCYFLFVGQMGKNTRLLKVTLISFNM